MKPTYMKPNTILYGLALLCLLAWSPTFAQDQSQDENQDQQQDEVRKPERPAFESGWLIDDQSVVVPHKGTFEFMIQHRFGVVSNGITDLFGIFAPSNIRLGFGYTLFDKFGFGSFKGPLSVAFGTTKGNMTQDLSLKYGLLQQTRDGSIPVSVTYFGNLAMETLRPLSELPNRNSSDRLSYFHQLIVGRRFSSKISLQVSGSLSHYNVVQPEMKNDFIAVAVGGRFKFSPQSAIIANVDQPVTAFKLYNPQPNVSFGIEIGTAAHTFQVFLTNFNSLVPQRNNVFNQNDPWGHGFLIGFNINRLWNF